MSAIRPSGHEAIPPQNQADIPKKPGTKWESGALQMLKDNYVSGSQTTSVAENHKVTIANKSDSFISRIINFITSFFSSLFSSKKSDAVSINNKMAESLNKSDLKLKGKAYDQIQDKYNEKPTPIEIRESLSDLPYEKKQELLDKLEDALKQACRNLEAGKDTLQEDLNRIGTVKKEIRSEIVKFKTVQGSLQSKKQEYLGKIDSLRTQMTKLKDGTSPKIKQQMGEDFANREKQFNSQLTEARNIVNSMTTTNNTQDADKALRQLEQSIQEYEGEVRFQQSRDNPYA